MGSGGRSGGDGRAFLFVEDGFEAGDVLAQGAQFMSLLDLAGLAAHAEMEELLADLAAVGQYRIGRSGYYQQHAQHDPAEAREVLEKYLGVKARV